MKDRAQHENDLFLDDYCSGQCKDWLRSGQIYLFIFYFFGHVIYVGALSSAIKGDVEFYAWRREDKMKWNDLEEV